MKTPAAWSIDRGVGKFRDVLRVSRGRRSEERPGRSLSRRDRLPSRSRSSPLSSGAIQLIRHTKVVWWPVRLSQWVLRSITDLCVKRICRCVMIIVRGRKVVTDILSCSSYIKISLFYRNLPDSVRVWCSQKNFHLKEKFVFIGNK